MRVITSLINASSTNITCNHLNLPTSILWGTAKKIDIVYDAAGGQLSRTVYTGAVVDYKQDYAAGVEYRTVGSTRKLESIAHAEGRRYNVNVNTGTSTESLRLEYSIRDHLGNNRLTFTDKNSDGKIDVTTTSTNEILSEQHYYSFGLSYGGNLWMNEAGDVDNRYLYNGKELNEDLGLNWLDYGARWYDPSIGRWNAVDPLAEKYSNFSPYNYVLNNPLVFIDPDGNDVKPVVNRTFNKPLNPRNTSDLGTTRLPKKEEGKVADWSFNINTQAIDISVNIVMDLSPEFDGRSSSFVKNNPGLKEEVRNHEDQHVEQIMLNFIEEQQLEIGGVKYEGRPDEILTQYMSTLLKEGGGSDRLNTDEAFQKELAGKINTALHGVILRAVAQSTKDQGARLQQEYPNSSKPYEDDANRRAIKKGFNMDYATGQKLINW